MVEHSPKVERQLGAQINQLRRDSGDGNAMNATLLQERDDRIAALERGLEELRATIAESAKAGEDNLREEVDSLQVEIKVLKKQKQGLLEKHVGFVCVGFFVTLFPQEKVEKRW